jgi:hypothetical protein
MLFATCAVAALASQWCGAAGTAADWLVTGCAIRSSVVAAPRGDDGSVAVTLSNGVVSRTLVANASTGLAATTSFSMLGEELLRTDVLAPEVLLAVNGVGVVVGGDAAPASDTRPRARFAGFRAPLPPLAGGFHWVPGSRGSDPNGAWPPRGVAAEFDHALGCAAVGAGPTGTIVATVRMELYDETSAFGRRVRLAHNCSAPLYVGNLSVSVYLPAHDRAITTATDASVAAVRLLPDPARADVRYYTNGHISTPGLRDFGPGLSDWRGGGGGGGGGGGYRATSWRKWRMTCRSTPRRRSGASAATAWPTRAPPACSRRRRSRRPSAWAACASAGAPCPRPTAWAARRARGATTRRAATARCRCCGSAHPPASRSSPSRRT